MFFENKKDLLQESEEVIENILGENATERKKQELLNSITNILEKRAKELLNDFENRNTVNNIISYPNNYSNSDHSTPSINIILVNSPINYPGYLPYQPQITNPPIISAYPFNTSPNPIQLNNPIQSYHPSPFPIYDQLQLIKSIPSSHSTQKKSHLKSKKSHKKQKHHHHHKKPSKPPKPHKDTKFTTLVETFTFSNPSTFSGL